jgi:ligand-binding sensor domain-containing protein
MENLIIKRLVFFFFLLGNSLLLSGQQFNFHNYSISDGLAQSQVFSMLKDSRGYLWLGTNGGGLSRFDGAKFKNYSRKSGLSGSYVFALQEDIYGTLWVGTDKGLCSFDGDEFKAYTLDSLGTNTIIALSSDKAGNLWIGTTNGLFYFDGKKFISKKDLLPTSASNQRINCLSLDSKDHLWIGMDNQIIRTKDNVETWSYTNGYSGGKVYDISEDNKGNIWLATYRGAYSFDGQSFNKFNTNEGLKSNLLQSLFVDKNDNLWFAYQDKGISVYNPTDSTFTHLSERDGLCKNDIRCITQDRWGNMWLGSSGGGISKYSGQQFEHFDRSNRLQANRIYSILQDTAQNMWVAASNRGFSVITDSTLVHHDARTDFINIAVKAMFQDKSGNIWIGTEGKGLALQDSSSFIYFTENHGIAGNWIKDIIEDDEGNLWVATNNGISKASVIKDSIGISIDFTNFDASNGLKKPYTNALHFDKRGRIWAAMRFGGLVCIEGDSLELILTKSNRLPTESIRSLAEDTSGLLWIGTGDNGVGRLSIYEDSLYISFLPLDKLFSENIYSLIFDDEQRLWVGSQTGVDCVSFTDDRNLKEIRHYGRAEGFVGIENCTNSVCKDQEGNLWFGTMSGLTKYNAKYKNRDTIPPQIRFTKISLEYTPLRETKYASIIDNWGQVKDSLNLPWRLNDITFEFQATDLSAPEEMSYLWKLEGLDDKWGPPVENNIMRFTNLPPGQYTFLVKSINSNDIQTEEAIAFPFTIQAPFWEKRWFPWAAGGLGLLLIGGIFRSRLKQLKRKAKQKEQALSIEKKMLELEQKALQLQMNPHFIFNTLNSIQGLIGLKDPKKARFYLSKFSRLMRIVLENSRSSMIPLEDEIESLENYLSLEQFGKNHSFDYKIKIEPDIDTEDIFIPPLMIQPFVENAIVHGLAAFAEGGFIQIHFEDKTDYLLCSITDNGIGRAAAANQKSQRDEHHKSMGLQVTAERLNILNQKQEESFLIEDILNKDGSVGGTKVELRFEI